MFDSTESNFSQGFNPTEPFLEGRLDGALIPLDATVRDLSAQAANRNSLQSLSAQRLLESSSTELSTKLSAAMVLDPLANLSAQSIFEPNADPRQGALDYPPEIELARRLQGVDILLTGGALDQTSLDSASGTFVVDESGSVEIDFLFDGGAYSGELAVFTLAGMGGLATDDFVKEAARRALGDSSEGQIVIMDSTEGAQFSGELGERDRNQGTAASAKTLTLSAGTRFAFMLVPNSTIAAVATGEISSDIPLFSIAALNPGGNNQLAQATADIFAIEDMQIGKGDADFNDIIFQVEGATSSLPSLSQLVNPAKNWLANPTAQAFLTPSQDPEESPGENPLSPQLPPEIPPASPADPVIEPPADPIVIVDISGKVNKFTGSTSEDDIVAIGADSVTIGTQTVYIGTEQVSSNNQNPIIRSFDPVNLDNNWTRQDLETTGTDGRGLGLIWTGTASVWGV